jgi:hypothetical protein
MLAALPLVLLPVLIHLLRRRRARRVEFPAAVLLMSGGTAQRRRRRLEDVLLLALRALIVLVAVLLFARPVMPLPAAAGEGQVRAAVGIVLDDSASMQRHVAPEATGETDAAGRTAFGRAQAEAERLLRVLAPGSPCVLVRTSAPDRPLVTSDPTYARERLRQWRCGFGSRPLGPALAAARQHLRQDDWPDPLLAVFSDFAPASLADLPDLHADDGVTIRGRRVADPADNWTVGRITLDERRPVARMPLRLSVNISRSGADRTAQRRELVLQAGGSEHRREVSLAAGESTTVRFELLPTGVGTFSGTAQFARQGADALALDDRRAWSVVVRDALDVMVLKTGEETARADIMLALAPFAAARANRLSVQAVAADLIDALPADTREVLVVPDSAELPEPLWGRIARRVRDGSGLLMFWNGRPLPASAGFVMPFRRGARLERGDARVLVAAPDHPFMEGFPPEADAGLRQVAFAQWVSATPHDEATVLLRLSNGDPLLAAREVGRGRVLMMAAQVGSNWSALTDSSAFLPLLHESVRWLIAEEQTRFEAPVGGALRVPDVAASAGGWSVKPPTSDDAIPLPAPPHGRGAVWDATARPGLYVFRTVTSSDALELPRQFEGAVQVSPDEGDLGAGPPVEWLSDDDTSGMAAMLNDLPRVHRPMTRLLLAALAALLIAETLLAVWFARRRRPKPDAALVSEPESAPAVAGEGRA